MAVRPIDGTWSKFVWNLGEKSESLARKFREGKACFIDLRLAVDAQPTLTPPNEWVSVEERLPEESYGMVLLTNGKVVISGYRNKLFGLDGKHGVFAPEIKRGGGYMQVTYWMPLPTPPDRRPHPGNE